MSDESASAQIDTIIGMHSGWKAQVLTKLRAIILQADPKITEEIKWRMASRPEGLPVWSHNEIVCFAEIWKDNVKLLFPRGAQLDDPQKLFNARLLSKKIRAIEFLEGDAVDGDALELLVRAATKRDS